MSSNQHPKFNRDLLPDNVIVGLETIRMGVRVITISRIHGPSGVQLGCGAAILNPRDRESMDLGAEIATGRAVKDYWHRSRATPVLVQGGHSG